MLDKNGGSIRSPNRYLKKFVKKQLKSFYVMDSRVSSNCTRNIYRRSTPEEEVNRKEDTLGKIAKRRQIATNSNVYASQIQILARFYSITCGFMTKKIGIFRARFIAFPSVEFPKIYWTVKHICALLLPVDKKIHKTKFEVKEENKNLQIARTLSLLPLFYFFRLLNDRQDRFHKL